MPSTSATDPNQTTQDPRHQTERYGDDSGNNEPRRRTERFDLDKGGSGDREVLYRSVEPVHQPTIGRAYRSYAGAWAGIVMAPIDFMLDSVEMQRTFWTQVTESIRSGVQLAARDARRSERLERVEHIVYREPVEQIEYRSA